MIIVAADVLIVTSDMLASSKQCYPEIEVHGGTEGAGRCGHVLLQGWLQSG